MDAAAFRASVISHVERSVDVRAARLRKSADVLIPKLLGHYGVETYDLHPFALNEAVYNCAKDLEKLAIYQKEAVDPLKSFGYMAFWIRKIKPVHNATFRDSSAVTDVNERLSLWLLGAGITKYFTDITKNEDFKQMAAEVGSKLDRLLDDKKRLKYLVHCMRIRTFGPHHYVLLLHEMIYGK